MCKTKQNYTSIQDVVSVCNSCSFIYSIKIMVCIISNIVFTACFVRIFSQKRYANKCHIHLYVININVALHC